MELVFAPKEVLQINDARITFKNFAGAPGKFNREGERSFALVIPTEEMADELEARGWNVRRRDPRDEDDTPFMFLPVKVAFNERGPQVYLVSGQNRRMLTENTVGTLDRIDIAGVDMDIRAYDWEVNGKTGRSAYLKSIHVTQEIDRFAERYARQTTDEEEIPFE